MNLFERARKRNGKLFGLDLGDKNVDVCVGLFPRFKALSLYGLFLRFKVLPLYGKVLGPFDPFVLNRLMKYFKPMNLFEMARKQNGKLLGLDLGDKNVDVCVDLFPRFKALLLYGKVLGPSDPFILNV
ncbi:hypothetical protein Q3G72_003084 [Acer saccharum]|nr:hypothetical protein Q3G72_003084 [Acer saccharum]